MVQFLTTIPLPLDLGAKEEDYGKGLVFAPVVGLLLGCLLAGAFFLLNAVFSVRLAAALIVAVYLVLTGGLHIDGLGDTFDGVMSHRSREKILEIMKDSRVGTNAVIAIFAVLMLDWLAISETDPSNYASVLLLFPVAGRIGSVTCAAVSRYARSGGGLGKSFIDYCGKTELAAGLILSALIFFAVTGAMGLIYVIIPILTALMFTAWFGRKIGGATGDVLGAVCELNQMLFLLFACAVM